MVNLRGAVVNLDPSVVRDRSHLTEGRAVS